jgi:hypothetical protein
MLFAFETIRTPTPAFSLASDYAPTHKAVFTDLPKEMDPILNNPHRVYGFFVNFWDYFYYDGNLEDFNAILKLYGKMKIPDHVLILHVGKGETRPLGKQHGPTITYNWSVVVGPPMEHLKEREKQAKEGKANPYAPLPEAVTITVHIDDDATTQVEGFRFEDLRIPKGITLKPDDASKDSPTIRKIMEGIRGDKPALDNRDKEHLKKENESGDESATRSLTGVLVAPEGARDITLWDGQTLRSKAQAKPGVYRLHSVSFSRKDAEGVEYILSGNFGAVSPRVEVQAGKTVLLDVGPPFRPLIEAQYSGDYSVVLLRLVILGAGGGEYSLNVGGKPAACSAEIRDDQGRIIEPLSFSFG